MNVNKTVIDQVQATIIKEKNNLKNTEKKVEKVSTEEAELTNSSKQNETNNRGEKEKKIIDAIEKASGKIEATSKGLEFSIHEKTNQIMIKVIDTNTNEVLKELPSEKILDMIAKFLELSGNFIDEKR